MNFDLSTQQYDLLVDLVLTEIERCGEKSLYFGRLMALLAVLENGE